VHPEHVFHFAMVALAALAAGKAGKRPSIVCLLAVLVCELLLHLPSKRINRGAALQVQSSEHREHADRTAADDDDTLLACVVVGTKKRIVIQAKDKPFWDYYYRKGNYFNTIHASSSPLLISRHQKPPSLNCKTYTQPPKPAATLENLTTHSLPQEVIDLIASSVDSALHCNRCGVDNFNIKFLEKCSTPTNLEQFLTADEEVKREGGTCKLSVSFETLSGQGGKSAEQTLQSCMGVNSYHWLQQDTRVFAACELESDSETHTFVKEKEEKIRGLQMLVDVRKQDVVHIKHIFEGL